MHTSESNFKIAIPTPLLHAIDTIYYTTQNGSLLSSQPQASNSKSD